VAPGNRRCRRSAAVRRGTASTPSLATHPASRLSTAQNRLLFRRDKYDTRFYRWVVRWFQKEWEDARLRAGWWVPSLRRIRIRIGLLAARIVVRLLARWPARPIIRFHPAEGR